MKICSRCKKTLPLIQFDTQGTRYVKSYCKRCCLDYKKEHFKKKNPRPEIPNLDGERWEISRISGYVNLYAISSSGRVKALPKISLAGFSLREKLLAQKNTRLGYVMVTFVNGKRKNLSIHRLVAKHFIPNPENKNCVNHKNGIKDDNRVENLEWCNYSENQIHAYILGLRKSKKGARYKIDDPLPRHMISRNK